MQYSIEMWFCSPTRRHAVDLSNLQLAAGRHNIEMEIIGQRQFRNMQRFGTHSTETFLLLKCDDKKLLKRFVDSIQLS